MKKLFGLDKNLGKLKLFEVQCRDSKSMLVNTDGMVDETLLTLVECGEINQWITNLNI